MSQVSEGQFRLDANRTFGDAIPATVRDVHAFADYTSGWVDTPFLYETPQFELVLETELGVMHATRSGTEFADACYGGFREVVEDEAGVDMRRLVGETLYLAPNDACTAGTLYMEDDPMCGFDEGRLMILKEPDRALSTNTEGGMEYLGSEARSVEWLNRQFQIDFERNTRDHNGWLERRIESVDAVEGTIYVTVPVADDWTARWEFDETFRGHVELREFATSLGLPSDIDELEGSVVYIHPIRNLHHMIPRESLSFDALERWAIATDPMKPAPRNRSWLDKLKGVFTSTSIDVSVRRSVRSAKNSDEYEIWDDCRESERGDAPKLLKSAD